MPVKLLLRRIALLSLLVAASALSGLQTTAAEGWKVPDGHERTRLIRSTLNAINDANLTSNYSVLYALSSPEFQERYTLETISSVCRILRDRKIDIAAALGAEPVIEDATAFSAQRVVQFRGYFPTAPARLRFLLSYQSIEGRWRLFGFNLSIEASERSGELL
jgi:hypothetical protein